MTYQQTLDYLFKQLPMFHRIGAAAYKANLDNSIALDKILKHPHKSFKTIHVGGTNGKGSTSNLLAAVLQSAGYKTGLFTSPHLKDFRERIRVNGKMISKKDVASFVTKHKMHFDKLNPSFFEWTVALAFDYFKKQKVDIAVIEVGLGGRLDSTNIISPILSVITNISYDHMNLLGNTLEKIAWEKAGVIKKNIPVVIGETQKNIADVFKSNAKKKKSKIYFADKNFSVEQKENLIDRINVNVYRNKKLIEKSLTTKLAGLYQLKNFQTVFMALEILRKKKIKIPIVAVRNGFENVNELTGFGGRWQILSKKPVIIADTAHNVDGLKQVFRQINSLEKFKIHIVFGVVADKEIDAILSLLPAKATYYFCAAKIPRAMSAKDLKDRAQKQGITGTVFASVQMAFKAAKQSAKPNDLIFIGGSTFTVAEIL